MDPSTYLLMFEAQRRAAERAGRSRNRSTPRTTRPTARAPLIRVSLALLALLLMAAAALLATPAAVMTSGALTVHDVDDRPSVLPLGAPGVAEAPTAQRRHPRRRPIRRGPPAGPDRRTPRLRLRDLAPIDAPALQAVFDGLSDSSRYLRFHGHVPRLAPQMQAALLDVDGRDHVALVGEIRKDRAWMPVGIGRLIRTGPAVAEVALEVVDAWQHRGVGRRLLAALRERAVALGYDEVHAEVLLQNTAILSLLDQLFPGARREPDGYGAATVVWRVHDEPPFTPLDAVLSAFEPLHPAAPPA